MACSEFISRRKVMLEVRLSTHTRTHTHTHTHTHTCTSLTLHQETNRKGEQFGLMMKTKYFGELLMGNHDIGGVCV